MEKRTQTQPRDSALTPTVDELLEIDALYSAAPAGLCMFDRAFRYRRINPALAAMNGVSVEAHLGKTPYEIVPQIAAEAEQAFRKVLETGQPVQLEIRGMTPANPREVRVWDEQWYPIRSATGEIQGVGVVADDITARKRAEEALASTERRFRASQEASPIAFTTLCALRDSAGAIVDFVWDYVNPSAAAILKRPAGQLVGRRLLEVLPGNAETSDLFQTYVRVVETGAVNDYEVRYESDGIVGWFRNIAVKLDDGVAVSFADMTARRRAEEALRVRSDLLQALVDRATFGVCMVDADFRIVTLNPAAAPSSGHCTQPVVGRDFAEVMREGWAAEYAEHVIRRFRAALATGEPYSITEEPAPPKHGEAARFYDWKVSRLTLPDSRPGVVCYFRDVTEQVRTREALAVAKQAAEAASAAKDRFLAVLSHELRTPLTPVLVAIEMLQHDAELPAHARAQLSLAQRNVELEVKLIDDLLDLSRVANGKLNLQRQAVRIDEVVLQACETCCETAREKQIDLRYQFDARDVRVSADPARLQQVFWNVLRNAVKFTPEGGRITVTSESMEAGVVVRVSDTGIGLAPEQLAKVFNAFEQGGAAVTKQYGGLGLGLAISKSLVELHGGTIAAASEGLGKGAVFTITLPVLPASTLASAAAAQAPPMSARPGEGVRILLVEDHHDSAAALARMLQARGYRVHTAGTVTDALRLCTTETFDVLVSDIGLPDGSGYDLMKEVATRHRLRGIAMSGYGMEDDLRQSREAGFSEHLVKPVQIATLLAVLRRVAPETPARAES